MTFKAVTVKSITEYYNSFLSVLDFVVGRTSESLAEILTKALPLVAPIPNAVSIYFVSQTALKYNTVQAVAVAASVECMFFALTEVVLKSWDMWRNSKKTIVPLAISVSAFVVYFILVMALVYTLEVSSGHSLAPLAFPVVSVVAAVALGVTRWHKRIETTEMESVTVAQLVAELDATKAKHNRTVAQLEKQLAQQEAQHETDNAQHVAETKATPAQRRETMLQWLRNGIDIKTQQVAEEFGVSATLIRRELAELRNGLQMNAQSGD